MKHRTKLPWKTPSILGQTVTIVGSAINQRTLRFVLNKWTLTLFNCNVDLMILSS